MAKKTSQIAKYIPPLGLSLAKYSGEQLIDKVGQDIIKSVVLSILCGGNVRSLTEGLTQRRISLSNASLFIAYLKASSEINDFQGQLFKIVSSDLQTAALNPEERIYLQWLIGLTGKSIQNVLRGDEEKIEGYLNELEKAMSNSIEQSQKEFGSLVGQIQIDEKNYLINWPSLLQIFTAIGAQTLAIRGSEKSMYGKLFEKLILGSMLTMLGFELTSSGDTTKSEMVFWLSQRESKRESDATILIKKGVGVRFDIGFIGPGNTEISLDKVSRFEREMEHGSELHFVSTIILVDRIGEGSRIVELAKAIKGNIVQMSMNYWIKEVCSILYDTTGFDHQIRTMTNEQSLNYISDNLDGIDLNSFVRIS